MALSGKDYCRNEEDKITRKGVSMYVKLYQHENGSGQISLVHASIIESCTDKSESFKSVKKVKSEEIWLMPNILKYICPTRKALGAQI